MGGILGILSFAADGLSEQQQAIANNLANANTPGFTAQDVDFESSLQAALDSQNGGTASVTVTPDPAPASTNGNNVDVSTQLVSADQATLQYQSDMEMLNAQMLLVEGAAGGSFTGSGS